MIKSILSIVLMSGLFATAQSSIHDFTFKTIDGKEQSFADFKGKQIMVVNTASECGFTSQYEQLQDMHTHFSDQLVIIGFPANNFGAQEPGTNEEITTFCSKNYGVSFLMAEKVSVRGDDIDPLFRWLCLQEGTSIDGVIEWNFEKFILDGDGKLIQRYRSGTLPNDPEVLKTLGI